LQAYEPGCARLEASEASQAILKCVTKTVLEASPRISVTQESIFEEELDLVALLTQKSLKKFFEELKSMILALVDTVNDTSSKQLALMIQSEPQPAFSDTQSVTTQQQVPEEE